MAKPGDWKFLRQGEAISKKRIESNRRLLQAHRKTVKRARARKK